MGIRPRKAYWCDVRKSWVLPLSQGLEALIDADDVTRVTDRCWSVAHFGGATKAVCPQNRRTKRGSPYLHHFVLDVEGEGYVWFRNGNTLDCRKANLSHNETIYELPHGIKVRAEIEPNRACPYWRVYIDPHPLFPKAALSDNGWLLVRRNRAVMTAKLGRPMLRNEHVHHMNEDKADDRKENLKLLTPAVHNTYHKTGSKHSPAVKARIAATLKNAYRDGRRKITGAAKAQMERSRASLR